MNATDRLSILLDIAEGLHPVEGDDDYIRLTSAEIKRRDEIDKEDSEVKKYDRVYGDLGGTYSKLKREIRDSEDEEYETREEFEELVARSLKETGEFEKGEDPDEEDDQDSDGTGDGSIGGGYRLDDAVTQEEVDKLAQWIKDPENLREYMEIRDWASRETVVRRKIFYEALLITPWDHLTAKGRANAMWKNGDYNGLKSGSDFGASGDGGSSGFSPYEDIAIANLRKEGGAEGAGKRTPLGSSVFSQYSNKSDRRAYSSFRADQRKKEKDELSFRERNRIINAEKRVEQKIRNIKIQKSLGNNKIKLTAREEEINRVAQERRKDVGSRDQFFKYVKPSVSQGGRVDLYDLKVNAVTPVNRERAEKIDNGDVIVSVNMGSEDLENAVSTDQWLTELVVSASKAGDDVITLLCLVMYQWKIELPTYLHTNLEDATISDKSIIRDVNKLWDKIGKIATDTDNEHLVGIRKVMKTLGFNYDGKRGRTLPKLREVLAKVSGREVSEIYAMIEELT